MKVTKFLVYYIYNKFSKKRVFIEFLFTIYLLKCMFHIHFKISCIKGCRSKDNPGLVQNWNPCSVTWVQDQDQRSDL